MVTVDDGKPFWEEEPPYLPQPQPMPRPGRGNFGPPRGMPRRAAYNEPGSVVNSPGYASELRRGMMVEAAQDAAWYRSPPPSGPSQSQPPPQSRPNIRTVRTVINEPRGYQPPGSQTQSYQTQPQSYQVQAQPQSYQVQAQPQTYQVQQPSYQVQAQPQAQQPAQVMYYDPKTGALTQGAQQYAAPAQPAPQIMYQQPQMMGYQAQPQVVGYQAAPQVLGYQQAAQPIAFAYPQQQQAQPIVVPGQLYTATGGVQQLG